MIESAADAIPLRECAAPGSPLQRLGKVLSEIAAVAAITASSWCSPVERPRDDAPRRADALTAEHAWIAPHVVDEHAEFDATALIGEHPLHGTSPKGVRSIVLWYYLTLPVLVCNMAVMPLGPIRVSVVAPSGESLFWADADHFLRCQACIDQVLGFVDLWQKAEEHLPTASGAPVDRDGDIGGDSEDGQRIQYWPAPLPGLLREEGGRVDAPAELEVPAAEDS